MTSRLAAAMPRRVAPGFFGCPNHMTSHATGTFDVTLTPQPPRDGEYAFPIRLRLEKKFQGDLAGTSAGEMLSAMTDVKGSAGYVALERVEGSLSGKHGTFALQHSGTMDRGRPSLAISVVPDSGSGELVGLTGSMAIEIADGVHRYDFAYALPEPR